MRCLLFVVCCLLVVWCLLFADCVACVVCCLLCGDCSLLAVVCRLDSVASCETFVASRLQLIVCYAMFAGCCLLFAVC